MRKPQTLQTKSKACGRLESGVSISFFAILRGSFRSFCVWHLVWHVVFCRQRSVNCPTILGLPTWTEMNNDDRSLRYLRFSRSGFRSSFIFCMCFCPPVFGQMPVNVVQGLAKLLMFTEHRRPPKGTYAKCKRSRIWLDPDPTVET